MAALLPLSADEAYYWLWSKHLAAGYFDHPPAIALADPRRHLAVRRHALGRAAGRHAAVAAWPAGLSGRRGRLILKDEDARRAGGAAVQSHLDDRRWRCWRRRRTCPRSRASGRLFCSAWRKLQDTGDGRWWLGAGVAAGLGLLSKYSGLFLGAGALGLAAGQPARAALAEDALALGGRAAGAADFPAQSLVADAAITGRPLSSSSAGSAGGHLTGALSCANSSARSWAWPRRSFLFWWYWALARAPASRRSAISACWLPDPAGAGLFPDPCAARPGAGQLAVLSSIPCWRFWRRMPSAHDAGDGARWCFAPGRAGGGAVAVAGLCPGARPGFIPLEARSPGAACWARACATSADRLPLLQAQNGADAILTTDYETTAWLRFYAARSHGDRRWTSPTAIPMRPRSGAG